MEPPGPWIMAQRWHHLLFAHWALDQDQYLELVISGVIRVFVTAPDGRTMTIRYCRSGELLGAMSLFSDEFAEPAAGGHERARTVFRG